MRITADFEESPPGEPQSSDAAAMQMDQVKTARYQRIKPDSSQVKRADGMPGCVTERLQTVQDIKCNVTLGVLFFFLCL